MLGEDGDKMLSEEVKWLAVTHKSFDQGRRGFNDRLAFIGGCYTFLFFYFLKKKINAAHVLLLSRFSPNEVLTWNYRQANCRPADLVGPGPEPCQFERQKYRRCPWQATVYAPGVGGIGQPYQQHENDAHKQAEGRWASAEVWNA